MSTLHAKAAEAYLRNDDIVVRHDKTFFGVRQKRDNMAQALPEWEDLREAASQIKKHTVTHLADYLEQFEQNATRNGIHVHWAADAKEYNDIVYDILSGHNVKKVVKSKSMLTEECHLNDNLERRGIEVIETDLGERILQMMHLAPSHIVMPALHVHREAIGDCFRKWGLMNDLRPEDIPEDPNDPTFLTYVARLHLRKQFTEAQAGMTGANFGIAATGEVVVRMHGLSESAYHYMKSRKGKSPFRLKNDFEELAVQDGFFGVLVEEVQAWWTTDAARFCPMPNTGRR